MSPAPDAWSAMFGGRRVRPCRLPVAALLPALRAAGIDVPEGAEVAAVLCLQGPREVVVLVEHESFPPLPPGEVPPCP